MKSFTEAYDYIKFTSAKDIATRTAIFGAYINMWMHKNLGHDIILDIVAALYGPFDCDFPNDTQIMGLLDTIHYGFDNNWRELFWKWACENATSQKELKAFDDMVGLLANGKCDEILVYFNYICEEVQPSSAEYFPEFEPFSSFFPIKQWPRI